MSDDNVIPLFNDRRIKPSTAPKVQPHPAGRAELYDHLQKHHSYGIAKNSNLTKLNSAHRNLHNDAAFSWTPSTQHVHGNE